MVERACEARPGLSAVDKHEVELGQKVRHSQHARSSRCTWATAGAPCSRSGRPSSRTWSPRAPRPSVSSRKGLSAVSKKVHLQKWNIDPGEFNKPVNMANHGSHPKSDMTNVRLVIIKRSSVQRIWCATVVPKKSARRIWRTTVVVPDNNILKDGSPPGDLSRAFSKPVLGVHQDSSLVEDEPTTGSSVQDSAASRSATPSWARSSRLRRVASTTKKQAASPCPSEASSTPARVAAWRTGRACWEDVKDVYYEEDKEEDGSGTPVIVVFLAAHGLAEYVDLFSREKVDLDVLTRFSGRKTSRSWACYLDHGRSWSGQLSKDELHSRIPDNLLTRGCRIQSLPSLEDEAD
ncbi:hypothetical protein HPB50_005489 [Hyalomma asiaticum]|uniref:Uncharacterized protein n=1 Tax=Hyalomma asiaticum TaxID=266040 RepID=A0ACB7T8I4_HYAAI|nr:hypothetical protein HPB50_005489 [Hyalomma asiaticum]